MAGRTLVWVLEIRNGSSNLNATLLRSRRDLLYILLVYVLLYGYYERGFYVYNVYLQIFWEIWVVFILKNKYGFRENPA